MELNLPVDSVLGSGLVDILPDGRALRNGFLVHPRPPGETEGVEVRVGADSGEAEEIPGAAHGIAGFEDGVAGIWELGLDAVRGVDAGDACADDDDVEVCAGGFGGAVHVGENMGNDRKVSQCASARTVQDKGIREWMMRRYISVCLLSVLQPRHKALEGICQCTNDLAFDNLLSSLYVHTECERPS